MTEVNKFTQTLYDNLKDLGAYDRPVQDFQEEMRNPTVRKALFDALDKKGAITQGDFNTFTRDLLGYDANVGGTPSSNVRLEYRMPDQTAQFQELTAMDLPKQPKRITSESDALRTTQSDSGLMQRYAQAKHSQDWEMTERARKRALDKERKRNAELRKQYHEAKMKHEYTEGLRQYDELPWYAKISGPVYSPYGNSVDNFVRNSTDYTRQEKMADLYEEAQTTYEAPYKGEGTVVGNFLTGAKEIVTDEDFLSRGFAENLGQREVFKVYDKINGILEQAEKDGLDDAQTQARLEAGLDDDDMEMLYALDAAEQAAYDRQSDTSTAYKSGQIVAESGGYMLDFYLTAKIANPVFKATAMRALKGLRNTTKATGILRKTGKYAIEGGRVMGRTGAQTLLMPSTWNEVYNQGSEVDEHGRFKHSGAGAVANGLFNSYIENLSENTGGLMTSLLKRGIKVPYRVANTIASKAFNSNKVQRLTTDFVRKVQTSGVGAAYKEYQSLVKALKETGYNGVVEEWLEEVFNAAAITTKGYVTGDGDDKRAWSDFWDAENQAATWPAFFVPAVGGSVVRLPSTVRAVKHDIERERRYAEHPWQRQADERAKWQMYELRSMVNSSTSTDKDGNPVKDENGKISRGQIQRVKLSDGREVYVTNGHVETDEQGNILPDKSDKTLTVIDNGKKVVVPTSGNNIKAEQLVSSEKYEDVEKKAVGDIYLEEETKYVYAPGTELVMIDPATKKPLTNPDGTNATSKVVSVGNGMVVIETGDPTAADSQVAYSYRDIHRFAVPHTPDAQQEANAAQNTDKETQQPQAVQPVQSEQQHTEQPAQGQDTPIGVDVLGSNKFGIVYQWVRGKAREAAKFLREKQSGYLRGVFHREGIGDIDLVWGDYKKGLKHIIQRHIVEQNDFDNVDEAMDAITDVIQNGKHVTESADKITIDNDKYRVVIAKNTEGHWILTAFDKSRNVREKQNANGSNSSLYTTTDTQNGAAQGVSAQAGGVSIHKDTQSNQDTQYPVGHVYTFTDEDGETIEAEITATNPDGTYAVKYTDATNGDYIGIQPSVPEAAINLFSQPRQGSQPTQGQTQPQPAQTNQGAQAPAPQPTRQTQGQQPTQTAQVQPAPQDPVQAAIDDAVALVGEDGVRQAVESTLNAKRKELENVRKKIADAARNVDLTSPKSREALQQLKAKEAELRQTTDLYSAALERLDDQGQGRRQSMPQGETRQAGEEDPRLVPVFTEDDPKKARERGWRKTVSEMINRPGPVKALMGKPTSVKFSTKRTQDGVYAVVEADGLQPSHTQGQKNPYHFLDEAQPKDREGKDSVKASRDMAAGINPEEITGGVTAYTGSPSINARGEVIQGNNRSDALKYMYSSEPQAAARYRQYLIDHAADFGLDAEAVARMEHPVLVNLLDVSDEDAIALGQYTQADLESGGVQAIPARNAATLLANKGLFGRFANILLRGAEDEGISELVVRNGRDTLVFLRNVAGAINDTQFRSAFRNDRGELTPEAKTSLADMLTRQLLGGNRSLEDMFRGLPAKAQKAIAATAFRDLQSPESERLQDELRASIVAFHALMQDPNFAAATNYETARRAMEAAKRQMNTDFATGSDVAIMEKFSNFALTLAALYKGSTQKQIQATFNDIYDYVQGTWEQGLFDTGTPAPHTLEESIKHVLGIEYQPINRNKNGHTRSDNVDNDAPQGEAGGQGSPRNPASGEQGEAGERPAYGGRGTGSNGGPKPVGRGAFGDIYDQFRGKAKEAFDFLLKTKNGYLLGVFHRDDIGDIDLAWGDAPTNYSGKGLAHIIRKHVETLHDFNSIEEAFKTIANVIANGTATDGKVPNTYNIEKGDYRVVIAKSSVGQWVLTAFDFKTSLRDKKKGTPAALTPGETANAVGAGAVAPNLSTPKDTQSSRKNNPYTIEPAQYVTKRGKVLDMFLVKFPEPLTKERQQAAKEIAKSEKGWYDREEDGFMMRSKESAQKLANTITGDEEAVQDAQPLSLADMREMDGSAAATADAGDFYNNILDEDKARSEMTDDDELSLLAIGVANPGMTADSPKSLMSQLKNAMQSASDSSLDGLLEDFGDHKGIAEAVRQEKKRRVAAVKKQQEKNHAAKQGDNSYGANNKLVSRERYEELKARMLRKLGGQLNMGIDPEILAIGTEMAAYHIEAGARKFSDYAARMIADLGDAIRPYLKSFYNGARDLPEVIDAGLSEEMTPYEDVRKTDVANLGKDIPNILDTIETIAKEQAADKQADEAKEKLIAGRNKQRKEEIDTFRPGERVLYKGKPAVVFEIDEDGTIVLDTGNAPVMYEVAHKEYLEKFPQTNNAKENNVPLASQDAEKTTPKNNDYGRRNENPRTDNSGTRLGSQELPEPQHLGAGTSVQNPARNSKSERGDAGVGSRELGTRPRYDVTRNYSNEEIGEIVSSITEIVDGKAVLTGEVTDDIVSIARQYESGGVSKKGHGTLDEYYTDGKIVDAVNLLIAPYFKGGKAVRVLEPSVGVGNFLEALHGLPVSQAVAFEINPITARITKILNPNVEVNLRPFETEFMDENGKKKPLPKKFGLVIGNPPYGDHRGLYKGLGEESHIKRYEDYFVKRSLDVLEEGGVLAMVLPSSWIDRHTKYGGYTIQAAYRLPSGAFEATKVGTDIVVLKKDSSIPVSEHSPYFEQHPERILGEKEQRKGRYGKTEEYVKGDIDTAIETIKREQAEQLANRLGIAGTNDNINEVQAAIEETGSIDNAEALLEYTKTIPGPRQAKKPKHAAENTGDKYKVRLNRKAESVPASQQFPTPFSQEEIEAFADTYYDGTFRHPEEHRKYANYIDGKAVHDFYYAEGDIYSKLEQLERDKQSIVEKYGTGQYEKQKKLLESVLPKRKGLDEISISPNSAFVKNLRLSSGKEAETLQGEFLVFLQKLPYQAFGDSSYWEVSGYVRNEQVYGSDKNRNALIRTRRKKAANDLFGKFLHEELTEDERDKVVKAFNREYNSTYRPDYSKVPIFSTINKDFKGKRLKLTSVQLAGIGRMTVKGVGVLAHEVGFGKTLSGVLAMHEAMTRGYARRPLIVVPNNNILQQWVETIYEALPNATVNTLGNLGEKYDLDGFTVNDGEFTIATYEGFKRLSFSDDVYDHLATKFSYITEDLNAHKSERDRQKAKAKKEETKGKMMKGSKKSYDFVDFGFDWLTFDEAHNANHIVSKVRLDKSAASDFRSQSQAKSDLGMKTWIAAQYIQEQNNGRNVLLLSATPFTNKPLEYYSILSLVANDMLRRKGFFNVNTFFETFMEADTDLEIGADGKPKQKTAIRRFKNNGMFQQLLGEFIDIKGEEDNPDLERPARRNKEYKIAQNDLTKQAMSEAQDLLEDDKTALQGITNARMAAFSPYATSLFGNPVKIPYAKFVENSPKINAAVKLIEQNKKDRPDAGQIIYSEIGKDFFPQIREYLINKSGFKPEEVQIITSNTKPEERIKIQEAYNDGTVKVIIGSGAIKEGMNLQKNTTDMYILSLPWNFTQLRQVEGRGWRQGNKWENIRINYMLTNDSIDVFMLQRLQTKQALYNEAMKKGAESVDVSDIDTAELKTALITNPETRADIVTIQERARLEQEKTRIEADLSFTLRKFDTYEKLLNAEKSLREDIERFKNYAGGNSDSWFAGHVQNQEARLQGIYEDIEEEKRKLSKKGIDVDDIQRKTDQARKAVASIEEKIERLGEYRQELVGKYRKEEEAKAEKQIGSLATYLNERATENKSGFYKIRPPKDGEKEARFRKADPATDLPLTEQEAALRDALAERLQEAGIEVEYVSEARLQELSELSGAKLEAKRKSEARRKRDEQNHAIDYVTSLITGQTEKEARQERLLREQQRRDLAKEIYDAVLQGNFNDVTLQKIDKYIDESTPKNTFGRRISQRVPQKMERSLHAGHRTNAVDALFTRISESAVGDAGTKLARNRSEREGTKEIKKELLKGWAIATGNWHTGIHDFTNDTAPVAQGKDSTVYKSKDGRHVIKFSKGKSDKRFSTDIDAANLFSFVFPSTAYDIVGYGEIDGNFVTILRQPVVDIERPLTEQERVDYMRSLGFEPMNKENTTFTNGNIVVSDLQRGNIVFSKKGNIAVLDADVKLYTKDIGGAYTYPPAATDTEQRLDSGQPTFQRDENPVIYGAAYKGKIYLNAERSSLDTPIHEYTHLWAEALRRGNRQEWNSIVDMLRGTPQWNETEQRYPELTTDDRIAEETLALYSGMRGAQRLREQQQKIASEARSIRETVTAMGAIARVKQALKRFWKNVADFLHIHYENIDEVADKVLSDMLDGVNPLVAEGQSIINRAKANGTYLKAPNGKPSNLSPRQWASARTAAFKDKYGDWEKVARIEKLRNSKPIDIEYNGEYDLNRDAAKKWLKENIRGLYTNADTNEQIEISKVGINEVTAHGSQDIAHLKSLSSIPKMIENSIYIDEIPNAKENDKYDSYRYYVCGLNIDGDDYTAKIVVGVKGDRKYYDHRLTQIEKGNLINNLNGLSNSVAENQIAHVSDIKDKRLVSILQNNYTGKLDENGEPTAETVDEYLASLEDENSGIRYRKAAEDEIDRDIAELQQQVNNATYENATEASPLPPTPQAKHGMTVNEYLKTWQQWKKEALQANKKLQADYGKEVNGNLRWWRKAFREITDSARPLERLLDWAKAHGGKVDISNDAYTDMFSSAGRATYKATRFEEDLLRPMKKTLTNMARNVSLKDWAKSLKLNIEEFGEDKQVQATVYDILSLYLRAKDIIEAAELGWVERGAQGFKDMTGMEASDFIQRFEDIFSEEEINILWEKIKKCTDFALQTYRDEGMMTKEDYDKYSSRQFYVPQRGWAQNEYSDYTPEYVGKDKYGDSKSFNAALVKAKGRTSLAADPLQYIEQIGRSAILSTEKNAVKRKFLQFARDNADLGESSQAFRMRKVWYVRTDLKDPETGKPLYERTYKRPSQEMFDKDREIYKQISELETKAAMARTVKERKAVREKIRELQVQINVRTKQNPNLVANKTRAEKEEHVVSIIENNEEYEIFTRDNLVANVLNRKSAKYNLWYRGVGKATRFFTGMLTRYKPSFAFRNFIRDTKGAYKANLIEFGLKYATQMLINEFSVMPAVAHYAWTGRFTDKNGREFKGNKGKDLKLLKDFFESGAATGFTYLRDLETLEKSLRKEIERGRGAEMALASWDGLKKFLAFLTEVSETSVRFAQFKQSVMAGYSKAEAASHAKEVTTNFDRRGSHENGFLQAVVPLYGFFNASIQGVNRYYRMGWKQVARYGLVQGLSKMASLAFNSFVWGLLWTMCFPDDPDDERYFSEYDRMSNLCIWKLKIPLPHVLRGFYGAGVMTAYWLQDRKSGSEALMQGLQFLLSDLVVEQFNILDPLKYDEAGRMTYDFGTLGRQVTPTAIQPLGDIAANEDFAGRKIYNENYVRSDDDNRPQTQLGRNDVNSVLQAFTNWLANVSGGSATAKTNRDIPYLFDLNPSKLEHVLENIFMPGVVGEAVGTVGLIYDAAKGNDVDISKLPLIGSFYRPYNMERHQRSLYWNLRKKADRYGDDMRAYKKDKANNAKSDERYKEMAKSKAGDTYRATKELLDDLNPDKEDFAPSAESIKKLQEQLEEWYKYVE